MLTGSNFIHFQLKTTREKYFHVGNKYYITLDINKSLYLQFHKYLIAFKKYREHL